MQEITLDENGDQLANAALLRSHLDNGPVKLMNGNYPCMGLRIHSGDVLVGESRSARLYSVGDGVMYFGNWSGDSLTGQNSEYSVVSLVEKYSVSIPLAMASDSDNYSVGDGIILWSEAGYTNGKGNHKPAFQHVSEIVNILPGELIIAHPIYRDPPPGEMRATSEWQMGGYSGLDAGWAKDVSVTNLTVSTHQDSWSRYGGAIRANVDIWVDETNGVFVQNGIVDSNFRLRSGNFKTYAIDMAFGCQRTNIIVDYAICVDTAYETPVVAFGECCHSNSINANILAVDDFERSAGVMFTHGTMDNLFSGSLYCRKSRRLMHSMQTAAMDALTWLGDKGNRIIDADFSGHVANFGISVSNQVTGNQSKFRALGENRLRVGSLSKDAIHVSSSNVQLKAVEVDAVGSLKVESNSVDVDISGMQFSTTPTKVTIQDGAEVVSDDVNFAV